MFSILLKGRDQLVPGSLFSRSGGGGGGGGGGGETLGKRLSKRLLDISVTALKKIVLTKCY